MKNIYSEYSPGNSRRTDWGSVILRKIVEGFLKRNSKKLLKENVPQIFIVSQDHISSRVLLNGIYERGYLDAAMEFLAANGRIFGAAVDAGANIGNHSLYFSRFYKTVYAFEPNPKLYKVLGANASLAENISCYQLGLSDKAGNETLHIINEFNLGEASADPKQSPSTSLTYGFRTVRLDDCDDIRQDVIGLLKLDVENLETRVLNGSAGVIAASAPIIFFEQHAYDFPADGEDSLCVGTLRRLGYNFFYEIGISPRLRWRKLKLIGNAIQHAGRLLRGYRYEVSEVWKFDQRFYSFIIASRDRMRPASAPESPDRG